MKIYNTLTRQKEDFAPLEPGKVKMYTCGVTVYDDCHIGHARSLYVFEVIRSYLRYRGFEVKFIRNITDVDDKIINRANELKVDWQELVAKYIQRYYQDMAALGVSKADVEPRATENIAEMIGYIEALIKKGFAYATPTGVYFSVRKFAGYGRLSGQSIDQMQDGTRKAADETKEDPLDFALWKAAKDGEPFWESPWGKGRPGWHIECSVMSQKYLAADTLDIHGGGLDLVFPHHENERAQSEALTGKTFAKYWMHHGLLSINSQKMSKSLGNFFTIKDVLAKYPAEILKTLYLQAHYSSTMDFSWDKMDEAKKAYQRIDILMGKLEKIPEASGSDAEIDGFKAAFIQAMDDDFNTPKALAAIFDLVNYCNKGLDSGSVDNKKLFYARNIILELTQIFGLEFLKEKSGALSEDKIESLVQLRQECKKARNFQEADNIRKELEKQGVILEDTREKTTWRRKI